MSIRDIDPAYPAFSVMDLSEARSRNQQRSLVEPTKDGKFHCAVCDAGLRACTCAWGHHNEPIRGGHDGSQS
jgi:hypothetical protein